ncbi:hypothetical protein K0M31_004900 [Melipona bicolor]|uniref:Uncharacterized protein n=1 Tax=Melipona bicolor TaxID=60889 RepID=A0AA40FWC0_9HYME|nr:hypothetical protein K0M31_004900 [Melipona bicolor]
MPKDAQTRTEDEVETPRTYSHGGEEGGEEAGGGQGGPRKSSFGNERPRRITHRYMPYVRTGRRTLPPL